jgi:hypothetical protein
MKTKGIGYGLASKEITGGRVSGGARGGATDPVAVDLATPTKSLEREEQEEALAARAVWFGLTLTAPFVEPFYSRPLAMTRARPASWAN